VLEGGLGFVVVVRDADLGGVGRLEQAHGVERDAGLGALLALDQLLPGGLDDGMVLGMGGGLDGFMGGITSGRLGVDGMVGEGLGVLGSGVWDCALRVVMGIVSRTCALWVGRDLACMPSS
jgi:hypothetical protein